MYFENRSEWISSMDEEIEFLTENELWTLATLPKDTIAVRTKSVFDINLEGKDETSRYKARLVAKDFL